MDGDPYYPEDEFDQLQMDLGFDEELPPKAPGIKTDTGKLMWNLLPLDALENVVRVFDHAVRSGKYAPGNWKFVKHANDRYHSALLRHLCCINKGEDIDPDTGLPHIYAVAANALILVWFHDHPQEEEGTPDGV